MEIYGQNPSFTVWNKSGKEKKEVSFACTDSYSTSTIKHMKIWLFDACFIFQALSRILWRIHSRVHTLFISQFYNKGALDGGIRAKYKMNNAQLHDIFVLWQIALKTGDSHTFKYT